MSTTNTPRRQPQLGEWYTQQILNTLLSNPEVWASTVLFIMYDENDGFFDHVPPPTAPPGTPGEYVTVDPLPARRRRYCRTHRPRCQGTHAGGVTLLGRGLGVLRPFDHTSQLRFLEQIFGVVAPNITSWRRSVVGDLTTTLPVVASPVTTAPTLPAVSRNVHQPPIGTECDAVQLLELNPKTAPYPVPTVQAIPHQNTDRLTPTPS